MQVTEERVKDVKSDLVHELCGCHQPGYLAIFDGENLTFALGSKWVFLPLGSSLETLPGTVSDLRKANDEAGDAAQLVEDLLRGHYQIPEHHINGALLCTPVIPEL